MPKPATAAKKRKLSDALFSAILLSYFDGSKWVLQGDDSLQIGSREGALVSWILATATSQPYLSRDVLTELELWLESDLISGPNTVFYSTMAEMLLKMGEMVGSAPTGADFYSIYDLYGLQAD